MDNKTAELAALMTLSAAIEMQGEAMKVKNKQDEIEGNSLTYDSNKFYELAADLHNICVSIRLLKD